MWRSFFYGFLLYYVAEVTATLGYSVVIMTSPQSPVPFSVRTVHLTCRITPLVPHEIVEYRWSAVPPYYLHTPNVSLPYARSYIGYWSPRVFSYYCHVYSSGTKIASGKATLKIQGFLQYITPPGVQFTPEDNVSLQFHVSSHPYASSIKTYHWFHKGWCIDCYSYDRYQLDLNNTRLTIINASENDIGQYEVRVTELQWEGSHTAECDQQTIEYLKYNAAYAPVTYNLTLEDAVFSTPNSRHQIFVFLYGTIYQSLIFTYEYNKPSYYSHLEFYSDGMFIWPLLDSPFYGTNSSHIVFNISQYNEDLAGEYTAEVYTICWMSGVACNNHYRDLICDLSDHIVTTDLLTILVSTLDAPQVSIQTNHTIAHQGRYGTKRDGVTLNCSAEGGNPEEYTVQLMKEGEQLMSTTSGPAVLLYSPSHYQQQFGLFTCSVVNEYFNINKSVLIQERASIHTLWLLNSLQTGFIQLQRSVEQIDDVFIKLVSSLCQSCNITTSNINNSNATLYNSVKMIYYTSDLVYSSNSGEITSSTLIDLMQQWLLQSENNITVHINNTELRLSKLCMLQVNPTTMDTCHQVIEYLSKTQTSKPLQISSMLVVGGGGALLGITLSVIGVIVIKVCCCICKRKKNPSESDNQEDIELDLNPSYSTTSHQSNLRYEEYASDPQYIIQEQSAYANTSFLLCSNDKTRLV